MKRASEGRQKGMNEGNDVRVRDKQEKRLQGIHRNTGQRKISSEWQLWVGMQRENGFWTAIAEVVENCYNCKYLHLYNTKCYCLMLNSSIECIFLQIIYLYMYIHTLSMHNMYIYTLSMHTSHGKKKILSAYILIAHVPVWPLAVRHHFPHDNTVAPHITG